MHAFMPKRKFYQYMNIKCLLHTISWSSANADLKNLMNIHESELSQMPENIYKYV